MASRPIAVACEHCRGTGTRRLPDVYAETLDLLSRQAGCKPSAMSNRLRVLGRAGLAEARRNGRECLWRAVGPAD